jgi:HEAT repeat protein
MRQAAAKELIDQVLLAELARNDQNADVRKVAVERLTDQVVLAEIIRNDSVSEVRQAGVMRLTDARAAVKPLIAALRDSNSSVRLAAAIALEKIGWHPGQDEIGAVYWVIKGEWDKCIGIGAPAVEPLIAMLNDRRGWTPNVAHALGKIGDARAIGPLIAALNDEGRALREMAAGALVQIGAPTIGPLIATVKDPRKHIYEAALETLVEIGTPAVEPLIAILKDADLYVRAKAASALARIGAPRAVEPLVVALKDEFNFVRISAASALSKMGWLPGQDEASAVYWIYKREWDKCVGIGAPAVEPLIKHIEDTSWPPSDPYAVGRALAKICSGLEDASLRARADGVLKEVYGRKRSGSDSRWLEGLNYDKGRD